jgi:hypothetical protein
VSSQPVGPRRRWISKGLVGVERTAGLRPGPPRSLPGVYQPRTPRQAKAAGRAPLGLDAHARSGAPRDAQVRLQPTRRGRSQRASHTRLSRPASAPGTSFLPYSRARGFSSRFGPLARLARPSTRATSRPPSGGWSGFIRTSTAGTKASQSVATLKTPCASRLMSIRKSPTVYGPHRKGASGYARTSTGLPAWKYRHEPRPGGHPRVLPGANCARHWG